jgi:hypothetical protein
MIEIKNVNLPSKIKETKMKRTVDENHIVIYSFLDCGLEPIELYTLYRRSRNLLALKLPPSYDIQNDNISLMTQEMVEDLIKVLQEFVDKGELK